MTNFCIAKKCYLAPGLVPSLGLSTEPLGALAECDIPELVCEIRMQFSPVWEESTFFFTPEMAKDLVECSAAFCPEKPCLLRADSELDSYVCS